MIGIYDYPRSRSTLREEGGIPRHPPSEPMIQAETEIPSAAVTLPRRPAFLVATVEGERDLARDESPLREPATLHGFALIVPLPDELEAQEEGRRALPGEVRQLAAQSGPAL